ncbi:hypothetical protein Pla123a_26030 [Posidoniimonas polymericola]|uniref:Hydantoinase A/oxoprolinase domain-containing protein n=1 Tax=Posidoniimonas polymericola TaxID=2528002 RepID=A0A5C5YLK7_9BACT|nr:hydantoinase/oxoprolinase family protein [Posidoniimonas polymericola]TWT75821.1 hypothetical protein Pla123a_26030 [Posidoniimonas polymericola]
MNTAAPWLGLDVGGANLKAATTAGFAAQTEFPLWQRPNELAAAIAELIASAPPCRGVAATMTGELADCYASKREGVAAIADALTEAAGPTPVRVYDLTLSGFIGPDQAANHVRGVAAGNWHALATACGRLARKPGVLIDVGSTTTDVVRFAPSGVLSNSVTDTDRLLSGELLYQGVGRTPVAALTHTLPLDGRECPVAAELFATTADAAVLLGLMPESNTLGADGRPLTRACSAARLARMICADAGDLTSEQITRLAQDVMGALKHRLADALRHLQASSDGFFVVSGAGEWLARQAVANVAPAAEVTTLSSLVGEAASVCAPAWAVAFLAGEGAAFLAGEGAAFLAGEGAIT